MCPKRSDGFVNFGGKGFVFPLCIYYITKVAKSQILGGSKIGFVEKKFQAPVRQSWTFVFLPKPPGVSGFFRGGFPVVCRQAVCDALSAPLWLVLPRGGINSPFRFSWHTEPSSALQINPPLVDKCVSVVDSHNAQKVVAVFVQVDGCIVLCVQNTGRKKVFVCAICLLQFGFSHVTI
jgi:hypothetical protein